MREPIKQISVVMITVMSLYSKYPI